MELNYQQINELIEPSEFFISEKITDEIKYYYLHDWDGNIVYSIGQKLNLKEVIELMLAFVQKQLFKSGQDDIRRSIKAIING